MATLFRPADYDPVAHPKRAKANSPFRLYAALVIVTATLLVAWSLWPPAVAVARPTLESGTDRVIASAVATNRTAAPRSITVRFDLGYQTMASEARPQQFRLLESRQVSAQVSPHSSATVTCEFA